MSIFITLPPSLQTNLTYYAEFNKFSRPEQKTVLRSLLNELCINLLVHNKNCSVPQTQLNDWLINAIRDKNIVLAETLLAKKADSNANHSSSYGYTPLIAAIKYMYSDSNKILFIKKLIDTYKANVNQPDRAIQYTPLMHAILINNSADIIDLLTNTYCADLTLQNSDHETALSLANRLGDPYTEEYKNRIINILKHQNPSCKKR